MKCLSESLQIPLEEVQESQPSLVDILNIVPQCKVTLLINKEVLLADSSMVLLLLFYPLAKGLIPAKGIPPPAL